jgi:hypothetical protein
VDGATAVATLDRSLWCLQAQEGRNRQAESNALARIKAASSWQEVQQGISFFAGGSYSQLPPWLLLATYIALGGGLAAQGADANVGAATGTSAGGGGGGLEKVRQCGAPALNTLHMAQVQHATLDSSMGGNSNGSGSAAATEAAAVAASAAAAAAQAATAEVATQARAILASLAS